MDLAKFVRASAVVASLALCCMGPVRAQTPTQPGAAGSPKLQAGPKPAQALDQSFDGEGAPVFHLLGFALHGTKRVDTAALVAALPQHEGDVITRAEIKQDVGQISAILKARHVHGDMTTATLERDGPGHWIWVVWDVHLVDALTAAPMRGKRHFASQSFAGNAKLSADDLATVTGLRPGDPMPDGTLSDARTAIEQAYDKALPGAAVAVRGKVKLLKDDTVVIAWQIDEPG